MGDDELLVAAYPPYPTLLRPILLEHRGCVDKAPVAPGDAKTGYEELHALAHHVVIVFAKRVGSQMKLVARYLDSGGIGQRQTHNALHARDKQPWVEAQVDMAVHILHIGESATAHAAKEAAGVAIVDGARLGYATSKKAETAGLGF